MCPWLTRAKTSASSSSSSGGKVEGALQATCQDHPMEEACEDTPNCVAVCVEGGPVSRVEEYMMDEIVRNVHVMGAGGTRLKVHIAVKRVTFEELQREVREVLKLD